MGDRERTRRRVLASASAGLSLGLVGCLGDPGGSRPTSSPTDTRTDTRTTGTETGTETEPESETTTEEDEGPGYIDDHWHGRLFFEVNGELVDFSRPKYLLENIEDDHPDAVYFHFHENEEPREPSHGPNEWSNEKEIITVDRALDLLPGIEYEQTDGEHVVTYEGTTYDARRRDTSISIREDDEPIDPTSYEVQHGDYYYVQVVNEDAKRSAKPAHAGADLGTLLFDINNRRIDFSRDRFTGPDAGSEAFHFHDDGNPYMWYKEGSTTLADALNALPGISYAKESGSHVIEHEDEKWPSYEQTYDANSSSNEIIVRERTTDIDPTTYEPEAGDVIWVYVKSEYVYENEH